MQRRHDLTARRPRGLQRSWRGKQIRLRQRHQRRQRPRGSIRAGRGPCCSPRREHRAFHRQRSGDMQRRNDLTARRPWGLQRSRWCQQSRLERWHGSSGGAGSCRHGRSTRCGGRFSLIVGEWRAGGLQGWHDLTARRPRGLQRPWWHQQGSHRLGWCGSRVSYTGSRRGDCRRCGGVSTRDSVLPQVRATGAAGAGWRRGAGVGEQREQGLPLPGRPVVWQDQTGTVHDRSGREGLGCARGLRQELLLSARADTA